MAQIVTNIPDDIFPRVVEGFAGNNNYQDKLPNGKDNPETKEQFMNRLVSSFIKENVKSFEISTAINKTKNTIIDYVDSTLIIT